MVSVEDYRLPDFILARFDQDGISVTGGVNRRLDMLEVASSLAVHNDRRSFAERSQQKKYRHHSHKHLWFLNNCVPKHISGRSSIASAQDRSANQAPGGKEGTREFERNQRYFLSEMQPRRILGIRYSWI
jgi:hypothetical protein